MITKLLWFTSHDMLVTLWQNVCGEQYIFPCICLTIIFLVSDHGRRRNVRNITQAVVIHISDLMTCCPLTECVWGTVYFPCIFPDHQIWYHLSASSWQKEKCYKWALSGSLLNIKCPGFHWKILYMTFLLSYSRLGKHSFALIVYQTSMPEIARKYKNI